MTRFQRHNTYQKGAILRVIAMSISQNKWTHYQAHLWGGNAYYSPHYNNLINKTYFSTLIGFDAWQGISEIDALSVYDQTFDRLYTYMQYNLKSISWLASHPSNNKNSILRTLMGGSRSYFSRLLFHWDLRTGVNLNVKSVCWSVRAAVLVKLCYTELQLY